MKKLPGIESPGLVLPTDPDDYYRANSGLFVPIRKSAPGSGEQPTLLLGAEAINACPDDILKGTEAPTSTYEPTYLWYDAPAALNRVIDSASLDSLKEKFGKLQQLSKRDKLLSVLNSRSSEEELAAITSDFYSLLGEVHARASSKVLEDGRLWDYLGAMADYLMIESDMQDLTMDDDTLQLILRGLDNHNTPEKLLDFIAHFDIPRELAGKLLDRIDDHPNHPLYWWVASRCPDHPVVAQQRRAVEALAAGDKSESVHLNLKTLLPLGSLLPDRTFPRTGLELETTTFVDAVKVPEGTVMGEDCAENVDGILELRLNHKGDRSVLNYGPEWLHRYFKVWRWEKIARGVSSSIHLHSDGNSPAKLERARHLFGLDDDSCRYNELGTVEVRSALDGYIDEELDGRGYSELPPPALIELLHLVEDTHSLLFLAARGRLGQTAWRSRVSNNYDKYLQQVGKQLIESVQNSDYESLIELLDQVGGLSYDMQAAVVEAMIAHNEHDLLIFYFHLLNFEMQKVVVGVVGEDKIYTDLHIVNHIGSLEPEIRMSMINSVLTRGNKVLLHYLARNINELTEDQQYELVEVVMREGYSSAFVELIIHISSITSPCLRDRIARQVIKCDRVRFIDMLIAQLGSLSSDLQNDILDRRLNMGHITTSLILYMGALSPEQQRRVIEKVSTKDEMDMYLLEPCVYQIKSEELRLEYLARLYKQSSPFQQTVIQHNTGRRNEAKLRRMP